MCKVLQVLKTEEAVINMHLCVKAGLSIKLCRLINKDFPICLCTEAKYYLESETHRTIKLPRHFFLEIIIKICFFFFVFLIITSQLCFIITLYSFILTTLCGMLYLNL